MFFWLRILFRDTIFSMDDDIILTILTALAPMWLTSSLARMHLSVLGTHYVLRYHSMAYRIHFFFFDCCYPMRLTSSLTWIPIYVLGTRFVLRYHIFSMSNDILSNFSFHLIRPKALRILQSGSKIKIEVQFSN